MNELKRGMQIESEHRRTASWLRRAVKKTGRLPSNKDIFKKIAQDHLKEHKDYYKRLSLARL